MLRDARCSAVENFRGASPLSATVERMLLRRTAAIAALACALALTACTTATPEPKPSASSSAPVFATDEEALAAAEESLRQFWDAFNLIRQEGGVEPERLAPFVSGDLGDGFLLGIEEFHEAGRSQVGDVIFDPPKLQQVITTSEKTAVMLYVCMDYGDRVVLDPTGVEIDLSEVPDRTLFEVTMETATSDEKPHFTMTRMEPWSDGSC